MKKRMAALLLLAATLMCGCAGAQENVSILTSFYPMYVFAMNVASGIPGVTVSNMADQSVGCLHDYQLQTRDMVALEDADVLVINGGGMEQFMDKVISLRDDLPVIDASSGIEMLCGGEHDHGHEEHAHHDEMLNAHVWLDPELAIRQIENIAEGLAAADSAHASAYRENAAAYIAKIKALDEELSAMLAGLEGEKIVTFHEAFAYFAAAYGIEVAGVISSDDGEEPSTRDIAKMCDLVAENGIRALFVEPQYPTKSADTIARETGAKVYSLNPVVSGDGAMDSYEQIMRENARVLVGALEQ